MTVLVTRALHAGYGAREVLHGIDLVLEGGLMVALVGPNGSGKTTLLRVLAGSLRPLSGSAELDGHPVALLDPRARARRIAVVPQTFTTAFAFTAREVASLGRTAHVGIFGRPSAADRAAVDRALALADCAAVAERPLAQLSGGERQRALVAMALAQEGDVVLLDEPTAHLDPAHQRSVLGLVGRLAREQGSLAIAVLHDLNLASAMAERVIVLSEGRVVADGPPLDVLTAANVEPVFGPGLWVGERDGVPYVLPHR